MRVGENGLVFVSDYMDNMVAGLDNDICLEVKYVVRV